MRQPLLVPLAALPREQTVALAPRLAPGRARRILAGGAVFGAAGDLLLMQDASGIGLALFLVLFAACIGGFSVEAIKAQPWRVKAPLAAGTGFALLLLFRDSPMLTFLDIVASLTCITVASALAKPGATLSLTTARVRDLLMLVPTGVLETATGAPRFLLGDVRAAFLNADGTSRSALFVAIARAGFLALTLVVMFAFLLAGGDPVFRSMVAWPAAWENVQLSDHVLRFGILAWPVLGLMWSTTRPPRTDAEDPLAQVITLNRLDVVTALGAMNALFALYLLLQLRVLFGGSAYVLATTGLTVAQYARDGFFALTFAAGLVLGVLLTLNALLKEDRLGAWRVSRRLSASLVSMVGLVMLSAVTRMMLYVQSFGISIDRIVALAVMVWLAMVAMWFVLTVLRERANRFVIGTLVAGGATLISLNAINPEAVVVRSQLHRATTTGAFDYAYTMDHLDVDAVPALVRGFEVGALPPSPMSCALAERLLASEAASAHTNVVMWSAAKTSARHAIAEHRGALRAHVDARGGRC